MKTLIKKLWSDPVWSKVIAAGFIALIGWLGIHLLQVLQQESPPPARDSLALDQAMITISQDSVLYVKEDASIRYLSEEQIRREISKRLEASNPASAINLLQFLNHTEAREEEANHIFGYCLKNGKLKDAEHVVSYFQSPKKKDSAMMELQLEKVKR